MKLEQKKMKKALLRFVAYFASNWYFFLVTFIVIFSAVFLFGSTKPKPPKIKASNQLQYLFETKNENFSSFIGLSNSPRPFASFTSKTGGSMFLELETIDEVNIEQRDNKVIFKNPKNNIDVAYSPLVDGLKEEIIINNPPGNLSEFYFDLQTFNAYPRQKLDGTFSRFFYGEDGSYQFHMEAPFAIDNNGARTDDIIFKIRKSESEIGKYQVLLALPKTWLNDPSRSYPIIIDPTFIHNSSTEFDPGLFNRSTRDLNNNPGLRTNYQELAADQYTSGLWHMQETSGSTVSDSSGNSLNGTATGTTVSSIHDSRHRDFDGVDDFVTVSDNDKLSFPDKTFTAEAWFRRQATGNPSTVEYILLKGVGTWEYTIRILTTGKVSGTLWTSAGAAIASVTSLTTVTDQQWHHAAIVADGTNFYLYVDGNLESSAVISGVLSNTSSNLYFGDRSDVTGSEFDGWIDEVRISSIARTPEEIKTSAKRQPYSTYTSDIIDFGYNVTAFNPLTWSELGVTTGDGETLKDSTSLIAQWNLNETSGTTAANSAGSCGSSCNGTLTGFDSTASQDADPDSSWAFSGRRWGSGALTFDGTDSVVNAGTNSAMDMGTANFSLETWVSTVDTNKNIVGKGASGTGGKRYALTLSTTECGTGRVKFEIDDDTTKKFVCTSHAVNDGNWHHLVGVRDGNNLRIYLDGKEDADPVDITGYGNINSSRAFYIGALYDEGIAGLTGYLRGIVDSTRLYARVLTSSEILSNYQAGNVQLQTRVGSDTTPEDGGWEEWRPVGSETSVYSFDTSLAKNLVSYWNLDEPSGVRTDKWGINNLTANGTGGVGSSTTSKINLSADFESTETDFLEITDNASLSTGDIDFTISAWVNLESEQNPEGVIVSKRDSGTEYSLRYISSSDTFNFLLFNSGGSVIGNVSWSATTTTSTWYHVVAWHDSVNNLVGINVNSGTPVTAATSGAPSDTVGNFRIGAYGTNEAAFFDGLIDEVGFWKRVLTSGEISYLYNSSSPEYNIFGTDITNFPQYGGVRPEAETVIVQENSASTKYTTGKRFPDAFTAGLWHLDETGGTGAYLQDSTANANHGTPTGTTVVNGISGKARNFNGSSDYINAGNGGSLPQSGNLTIDSWFKTADNGNTNTIVNHGASGDWLYAMTKSATNQLHCKIYQANSGVAYIEISSSVTVNDGKWHHGACVLSGTTLTVYVDGVASGTTSTVAGTRDVSTTGSLSIGRFNWSTTYNFNGAIDQVRISNVARTGEEVALAYRSGRDNYIEMAIPTTDLSDKPYLSFFIAADRPGTYLEANIGESAYVNNQSDINTAGLWHFDENEQDTWNLLATLTDNGAANPNLIGNSLPFTTMRGSCADGSNLQIASFSTPQVANTTTGLTANNNKKVMLGGIGQYGIYNSAQLACNWAADAGMIGAGFDGATCGTYNTNLKVGAGTDADATLDTRCNVNLFIKNGLSKDSSGNRNHANVETVTMVPGKIGNGVLLNGSNNYINIADSTVFDTQRPSISAWAYAADFNQNGFIFEKGPVNTQYSCYFEGGFLKFRTYNASAVVDTLSVTLANAGIVNNQWNHVACVYDGTAKKIYANGKEVATVAYTETLRTGQVGQRIGAYGGLSPSYFFNGILDEVRVDRAARAPERVRQNFELGLRTHTITIDFGAKLDSGNLITASNDLSFTVDATYYGLREKGRNLFPGDKVIIRENYNGTEYKAQGTVNTVASSTGAVVVLGWDAGSTFPASGFTANADVFKWQKEYWPIDGKVIDAGINAVDNLNFRFTNGNEGRTVWLDDLRTSTGHLTDSSGSTITSSTGNRYLQYRVILTSTDDAVTPIVEDVTVSGTTPAPEPVSPGLETILSPTSIRWNFTDNANNEDGFKLFDGASSELISLDTPNISSITETGLTPNTSYTRKVAAYNGIGNSLLSSNISGVTHANIPGSFGSDRTLTTAEFTLNVNSNPANTVFAVYKETGSTCDGTGGNYLTTSGADNGSTAVWATYANWGTNGTVTVSGLNEEAEYVFCVKARNSANVETAFSPAARSTGVKVVPISGNLTIEDSNTIFLNRYKDGSNPNRYIIGLDTAANAASPNSAQLNLAGGSITINSDETLVAGSIHLTGGSIFIAESGARMAPGAKLWALDRDEDGYPDTVSGEIRVWYGENAPQYGRRKALLSTLKTADCNDNEYSTSNVCCQNYTYYLDSDSDGYGSTTENVVCQVNPSNPPGYVANNTDCNDSNAQLYQNINNAVTDADQDGYVTGAASTQCLGATSVISSRTYYRSVSGNFDRIASAQSLGTDCNGAITSPNNIACLLATGGTITTISGYKVHTFTTSGTLTVTSGSSSVEYLVVAGGGGGGSSPANEYGPGGGGAGGMLTGSTTISANTSVTVGNGGTGANATRGNPGGNSVFGAITATGGGGGGGWLSGTGANGGSGGGGLGQGAGAPGGTGVAGQGNNGGQGYVFGGNPNAFVGGGGGGKSAAGVWGNPTGGAGLSSSITGGAVTYATGGNGAPVNSSAPSTPTANRGHGGHGYGGGIGSTGSTGVVIIRYPWE